jgi:hypothetical protein
MALRSAVGYAVFCVFSKPMSRSRRLIPGLQQPVVAAKSVSCQAVCMQMFATGKFADCIALAGVTCGGYSMFRRRKRA